MIVDFLTPPQGPWVANRKSDVARPIHLSNSHTKFGWRLCNDLGEDIIMDRQTDLQTDGWC